MPRSPLIGWIFVLGFGSTYDESGPVLTALWIAALLLPGSYWAGRASTISGTPDQVWAVPAFYLLFVGAAMLIVPLVAHQSAPGRSEWAAALVTIAVGVGVGRVLGIRQSGCNSEPASE
jgi:hypothetical protein